MRYVNKILNKINIQESFHLKLSYQTKLQRSVISLNETSSGFVRIIIIQKVAYRTVVLVGFGEIKRFCDSCVILIPTRNIGRRRKRNNTGTPKSDFSKKNPPVCTLLSVLKNYCILCSFILLLNLEPFVFQ